MADTSLFYYNPALAKTNARCLSLQFQITGAKAVTSLPMGPPILNTFDAIASQAVIDDFLSTVNEFLVAQYDATSMGTDAQGVIINMDGQVSAVTGMDCRCYHGTPPTTLLSRATYPIATLTSSTLETAIALGAFGNIGLKFNWGNSFDGFTDGYIIMDIYWISK